MKPVVVCADERTDVALHMTVLFSAGECNLLAHETTSLQQWIGAWLHSSTNYHVLIGGALETSRTGRLRRLAWLTAQMERLGIPKKRIHSDEDWLKPTRMGALDNLPFDAVWIQLRTASDMQATIAHEYSQVVPRIG